MCARAAVYGGDEPLVFRIVTSAGGDSADCARGGQAWGPHTIGARCRAAEATNPGERRAYH